MKPKIVMEFELGMGAIERLREIGEVLVDPGLENAAGADVIIPGRTRMTGEVMDKIGDNLKMIARTGIGLDTVDIPAATERNILVVHTPDAPTESTAEHAVALLMAVAKRVMVGDMQLRGHDDSIVREDMRGTELLNRKLGVVGYGRIGRRVAEICALGLKMDVTVYDPFIDLNQETPAGITLTDDLDGMIRQSKFVTLHVPLMPETRHLMNEERMRSMEKGSYVINASRGPVLDEKALIKLLEEGHIAAAGLDVFDPEPPEPNNPLLKMKNVVLTPHIASGTDKGIYDMMHGVVDQIIQITNGEAPRSMANPDVWPGRINVG